MPKLVNKKTKVESPASEADLQLLQENPELAKRYDIIPTVEPAELKKISSKKTTHDKTEPGSDQTDSQ